MIFSKNKLLKTSERIKKADLKISSNRYLTIQYLITIIIFILVMLVYDLGYIYAPIISITFYYLYDIIIIDLRTKERIKKLEYEALDFFEILALSLESGKNLENALEVTVFNTDTSLSSEFKQTLFEIKFGKSFREALVDTTKRIPSETINNIILNIIETDKFGNNIINVIYNKIEFLRKKRILEIKGIINKIPNQISIISVIFMLPLILIIVLGPIIINFIN